MSNQTTIGSDKASSRAVKNTAFLTVRPQSPLRPRTIELTFPKYLQICRMRPHFYVKSTPEDDEGVENEEGVEDEEDS
eukprot:1261071-Amorphochlora_amoeboformis.AAC.1